jgi:hypothetical protein
MDFKIDTRKRVKITIQQLGQIKRDSNYNYFADFLNSFCTESGLSVTSRRWSYKHKGIVYYFKILNKQKYMLGKIKYGI